MAHGLRNSLQITFAVWHAMFLREALDRLFDARGAWLWLLFEPIMWIILHVVMYLYMKHSIIGGMHLGYWTAAGFLAFLLWRRTFIQTLHAIDCNKAYFAYRQVKPFDAALIRGFLELFLIAPVTGIVFGLVALGGYSIMPGLAYQQFFPSDPLLFFSSMMGLWLFGIGVGLVLSVMMVFVPEVHHMVQILFFPLFISSGAIIPVTIIPLPYRNLILANPVVHGVESVRQSLLASYYTDPSISLEYLYSVAVGLIFLGMALYKRFDKKLVMR